jgi:NAD(P)-dependent dehydrogenase (short-subunit alcohol dehydrogenase family)
MKPFSDAVAIVTGGASGIGQSMCSYLARRGAKVVIVDCNLDEAQKAESFIRSQGGYGKAVFADVSRPQDIQSVVDGVLKDHGRIDYFFNNAGISINGEFQDITLEHWQRILDVNLWGVVYGCRSVYPVMVKQGFGHIINTASLAGLIPGGLTTPYSASKHAVVGFTLTLRGEAKQYGIKISVLCPGYIRTNIQKTTPCVTEYMNSEKNKKMEADMKFLTPQDCIDQIMRGVARNKGIILSPNRHRVYWGLNRMFPEFLPNMWNQIIVRMKKNA